MQVEQAENDNLSPNFALALIPGRKALQIRPEWSLVTVPKTLSNGAIVDQINRIVTLANGAVLSVEQLDDKRRTAQALHRNNRLTPNEMVTFFEMNRATKDLPEAPPESGVIAPG